MHLVLHALAIKKHAGAQAVAELAGVESAQVEALLQDAVAKGRVAQTQGKFMLTPLAQMALQSDYSKHYTALRSNAEFVAAYEAFEKINVGVKALITRWQTLEVGGNRVPNDHSDPDYDMRVIDDLGRMHERAEEIVGRLAAHMPRMQVYQTKLLAALERAEEGQIAWISDYKIDSYHTVWFELHEDLLRLIGRQRVE